MLLLIMQLSAAHQITRLVCQEWWWGSEQTVCATGSAHQLAAQR